MKVVIVGCGRVGSTLARRLAGEGHDVSIVELNVAAFNRLGEDFSGNMVPGNGLDEQTLRRAGIEKADAFAAVTNGDNRNLMMAQVAKEIFRVPRVITRVYDPIRAQVYQELGLETICSTIIGASLIHDFFIDGVNRAADASRLAEAGGRR
ncbi:MAG TPA: TrkA family potassium uptake protein [Candidatus Dormibacteraeota bacterium]|nr:TrkA family potassium uptake protein [Candidatus Dormibacteraeota bacterium]